MKIYRIITILIAITLFSFSTSKAQSNILNSGKTKSFQWPQGKKMALSLTFDDAPNDPSYVDMSQLTGMELDGKSFDEIKQLIESGLIMFTIQHRILMIKENLQTLTIVVYGESYNL